jgi:hypothetical protein
VAGELWRERTGALAKFRNFSGILVDFWSALVPIYKYFSGTEGHAVTSQKAQGPRVDLQQAKGPNYKSAWNMEIPGLFSMGNLMDWVHDAVDRWRGWVHGEPAGGADAGNGGPSSRRGTQALEGWLGSGATMAKIGGGSSSVLERQRARESSGVRGKGAGFSGGGAHLL